jgi:hypothetical protein
MGPYGPYRLTFDDGIVVQPAAVLAFQRGDGLPVLTSHTIVEMKFRLELPAVFKHLVETFALQPASVSKYRLGLDTLRLGDVRTGPSAVDLSRVLTDVEPAFTTGNRQ